ncbi:ABC transporter permease [Mycobacterium sp. CBMA293]|uniref:ABC transporter permease n=1 Tax=unclassified Mycolicibacterium TaxID=2636767 RepID=UPI0012DD66E3|nr:MULTISPECIES: ABC transporter permease [unclassified Mycolicibacterium]MUL50082.1 ABC transporter permease [Mycolicibacterium sp. CBMA 360]MUL62543.1 ABC transporter permease [Mycolicibacterium sp. CBMA 335]MUL68995.1 ABC transporter permease [Mycolicibacterium sp. CBMA 311]MUL96934.1 ABC transporter permease [Mycolicibacterium sp. CBMA 230]MUM04028.1 ABC transporter permease [Mycolicibacterium sp. CBMA 213]
MNTTRSEYRPEVANAGVASAAGATSSRTFRTRRWAKFLEAYALVFLLIATFVFFSVYPPTAESFLSTANLQVVFAGQAVIVIVSLGVLLPLITQDFDMSLGALAALSAIVVAEVVTSGVPVVVSIAVGIAVGALIGGANALIVTRLRVNAVVSTLGVGTVLGGVIIHITGGLASTSNVPAVLTNFGTGNIAGVPTIFLAMLAVAGVALFVLEHTPIGRYLYALGSNPDAARMVGLRTDLLRSAAFLAGGTLAGLAGVFYVARAGGADPKLASSFMLPSFAAAFLSAASIRPGRFNVGGVLVAIYFLAVLNSGLTLAGAPPYVSDYLNGLALIIGVSLAAFLSRRRAWL